MNVAMWGKALRIIPRIEKSEWDDLDVVSRWLIATRAAVLIMTFISASIAGICSTPNSPTSQAAPFHARSCTKRTSRGS